ncbi:MAG: ParA family protein [Planktothrix sp.]
MKVILCTHNSGGVGKTTLAVHLAGVCSELGKVLLVDCDEQADAWKFYAGDAPETDTDIYLSEEGISVLNNPRRKSIKKFASPSRYDYVVLDMDTPLPNIVTVIVGSDPDLILIPVNYSQKYKALKNLKDTLEVILALEAKATFIPQVRVTPLGINADEVIRSLEKLKNKPANCTVSKSMPNVQDIMQQSIYEERNYIWNVPGHEDLRAYFDELIEISG